MSRSTTSEDYGERLGGNILDMYDILDKDVDRRMSLLRNGVIYNGISDG